MGPKAVLGESLGRPSAYLNQGTLARTIVYIDGFNLYYRALRGTPYKWLDIAAMSAASLPADCQIERVNYYTAHISGRVDPDAPRRQHAYLRAIETLRNVVIHYGNFMVNQKWSGVVQPPRFRPLPTQPAVPDPEVAFVWKTEEKGSDVNLGVHLVRDAFRGQGSRIRDQRLTIIQGTTTLELHRPQGKRPFPNQSAWLSGELRCHSGLMREPCFRGSFDIAAVLTNDTDLVEPMRIVSQELGMHVTLLTPAPKPATSLVNVATSVRHIQPYIGPCQMPDPVPVSGKKPIAKPANW